MTNLQVGAILFEMKLPLVVATAPPDESHLRSPLILVSLLAAAAIIRLIDLGDGPWFDEIVTLVHYVRLPLSQILTTFDSKNQHILYSALAHGSVAMFGESIWALRLPAAVLGVASIAALVWFGRLITSRAEALAAAALLTFSYHHVWFSQDARGYTALLLAALVASGLLVKMTTHTTGTWQLSIAYAATMALAVYTHFTAALIVIGHFIWLAVLVARNRRKPIWPAAVLPLSAFALTAAFALLLYAPLLRSLLPTLLAPDVGGITAEWKNPLWFGAETVRSLARGLPGGWVTLAAVLVVSACGLANYVKQNPAIASLMLLPPALTAVAILAVRQNLWPRFFFFAAGFVLLIVIRGTFVVARHVWPARSTAVGSASAAILIVASATTVPKAWRPKQDYFAAGAFTERSHAPGDAIVTVDMTEFPFRQYQGRKWLFAADRDDLVKIEGAHARTWVLLTFPLRLASVQPQLLDYIQRGYVKVAEFGGTIAGGEIIVMVR